MQQDVCASFVHSVQLQIRNANQLEFKLNTAGS